MTDDVDPLWEEIRQRLIPEHQAFLCELPDLARSVLVELYAEWYRRGYSKEYIIVSLTIIFNEMLKTKFDETMTLQKAMRASKSGDRITRKSWSDKYRFIEIIDNDYIAYPFDLTKEDELATDWEIIEWKKLQ